MDVLDLNSIFSVWDTYYNSKSNDLYFLGIKKGTLHHEPLKKYVNNGVVLTTNN